jgi:hypothetical protein
MSQIRSPFHTTVSRAILLLDAAKMADTQRAVTLRELLQTTTMPSAGLAEVKGAIEKKLKLLEQGGAEFADMVTDELVLAQTAIDEQIEDYARGGNGHGEPDAATIAAAAQAGGATAQHAS